MQWASNDLSFLFFKSNSISNPFYAVFYSGRYKDIQSVSALMGPFKDGRGGGISLIT